MSGTRALEGGWSFRERYEFLAGLLAGRLPAAPMASEAEWRELLALAHAHGVGPLLHHTLRSRPEMDLPAAARAALAAIYQHAVYGQLFHASTRAHICRSLRERSIPVLLLKGAALAFTCYDDPATRPMIDVDLLVPRSRVEEAARCLEEAGFRFLSGSWALERRRARRHMVCIHAVTEATVELHWDLKVLGPRRRAAVAEIWAGARPAGFEEAVLVMRPGHTIPLLCAHMTLQHQDSSLLRLFDLHQVLLATDGAEGALVRDAATRWGLAPCTALSLLRAQELFGTPLPDGLEEWAREAASRDGLQTRMAALALTPDAPELPNRNLVDVLLRRSHRSLLQILFPPPEGVGNRLGLPPDHPIGIATYGALQVRRLHDGPALLRQLWRCWRAVPGHGRFAWRPGGPTPARLLDSNERAQGSDGT